ncbi:MAG TPA: transposase [Desulfobulbaceae bacterium]|nr:transposase [Desulfobulbaceae bacterium]
MILLSSIIQQFKHSFLNQYQKHIKPDHLKALGAMEKCRQEHGPQMRVKCTDNKCGKEIYIPHSCGHRSCPHCQNHESQQWIDNQLNKLLPARYFLITFTIPRQLKKLALKNQKTIYSLMFACVQDVLKTFTINDKKLMGAAGFTALLHTHSRPINYHPHIHVVMPAASIDEETGIWRVKDGRYIFNHKALAKVFRAKLLHAIVEKNLQVPKNCPPKWVVDCKDVGKGDKALIYLGRYLYRGVIQEKDILKCENGMITFRYINSRTERYQTRTVTGEYFLYLLMLHVLPKRFRRTRDYGFLHPCSKKLIKFLQLILKVSPFKIFQQKRQRPQITCPLCGAKMRIIKTRILQPGYGDGTICYI